MLQGKDLNRSHSSSSSVASSDHIVVNGHPKMRAKSPTSSEYEYLGRVVTRERPVIQKLLPKHSVQHDSVQSSHSYHQTKGSHHQNEYESESSYSESGDDDGMSKPLGVIRISDRHFREIYRLPTPPPKVKRVIHRLKSPEPKVIERIYVRRPPKEIIENIIEVPPERVRIIKREKILERSSPITRSRLIHLQPKHRQKRHLSESQQQHMHFIPSDQHQYSQQTIPSGNFSLQQPISTNNSLFYAPPQNIPNMSGIQTTFPSHNIFNTQQATTPTSTVINSNPSITTYTHQVPPQQQYYTYQQSQPQQYYTHQQPQYYYPSQPQAEQYHIPATTQQMMIPNNPYGHTQF